ncbi:hypothetical protein [Streptomyces anulatus]|nr:hypothetical protein [Streptomyces anulatus]
MTITDAIHQAVLKIPKKAWPPALTSILHDGPPTESVDRFAFGG